MRRSLLPGVLLLAVATPAAAGPWPVGRGKLYAKLSYQHLSATRLAHPDGSITEIPRFVRDEAALYAAVGLHDRLTLTANVPFLRSADLADEPDELRRETGFGDVQAGLQLQLGRRGNWVFAARGMLQAPTGDETRAQGLLPTGSGAWEGEAVVGAGLSFARGKGYGFVEAGHQFRGQGLRDGLVYAAQVGWNAGERLVLAANLRGVEPYDTTPPAVARGAFVGVGDRVTYVTWGPTLILKASSSWSLQLDLDSGFHARNLAKGPVLRAGLVFSR